MCLNVNTAQPPTCTNMISTDPPANDECESPIALVCDSVNTQCLLFSTANTGSDPGLNCELGEADGFSGSVTTWYAITPTDTRLLISLCDATAVFPNGDFLLAAYTFETMSGEGEGDCGLVQFACSEDSCAGNKPVLCLNDLTIGQQLIIEVAGHNGFDGVEIQLDVTCDVEEIPPVPDNDLCENATVLNLVDQGGQATASAFGSTLCASLDGIAGGCGDSTNGNAPGVWFTAMGDGTLWEVTQCIIGGGEYDSQLNVYCGECSTGLICLAGNNDLNSPCATLAELTFCTEVGRQYWFFVHGFFDVGEFGVRVTTNVDFEFGCDTDPTHDEICVTVMIPCPEDATIDEMGDMLETCGDDINNGCLTDPNSGTAYIDTNLPIIACGQIDAANNLRDLDDYRFTVTERSILSIDLIAEFNCSFFFFDSDDCATNAVLVNAAGPAGTNLVANVLVNPGVYVIRCSTTDFSGNPCGRSNTYVLRVSTAALGRCCIAGEEERGASTVECCVTTSAFCDELEGVFEASTDCSPITYVSTLYDVNDTPEDENDDVIVNPEVPFNTIVGVPNVISIGDGMLGDDAADFLDLMGDDSDLTDIGGMLDELPFKFFGENRDDVAVVSNGNLAFPNGGVIILDASPNPIPTPGSIGSLNDYIGGLWADFDPTQGGSVSAALIGSAPFRTLVVEYNGLQRFNGNNDSNTFQIHLLEGSNCVRFLYNDIQLPVVGEDVDNPVYVVGVENQDGTAGSALDQMTIEGLDTSALSTLQALQVEFCPEAELSAEDACSPGCPGDCDGSGTVDFNDLVSMLFFFGQDTGDDCDADESGNVDFNDLVSALFVFGPCS